MRRILSVLLLAVLPAFSLELYHRAPGQLLEKVPATLEVITPAAVQSPDYVRLYLRNPDQQHFQEIPFVYEKGTYTCTIPAAFLTGGEFHYYITASFDTLGLVALPSVADPSQDPYRVKLLPFDAYRYRSKEAYDRNKIADIQIIPWQPSVNRPSKFPVRYLPKPGGQYQEMGYIIVSGTRDAGATDLLDALLQSTRSIGAHAVSSLKFGIYTSKPTREEYKGVVILEGVYLQHQDQK